MKIGFAKTTVLNKDGSNQWGTTDAKQAIDGMRATLNDGKGGTRPGYLRLTKSGDMNAGGFFTAGKTREATDEIKKMIRKAYEGTVPQELMDDVSKAIEKYLTRTGGAFGTRSFVKLIDFLDHKKENLMAPEQPSANTDVSKARLTLTVSAGTANSLRMKSLFDELRAGEKNDEQIREVIGKLAEDGSVSATGLKTFQELACQMNKDKGKDGLDAFIHFAHLMFPRISSIGGISKVSSEQPKKFVMGDADGSMGRMVLHALASGVATLADGKIADLALVLQREHEQEALEDEKRIQKKANKGKSQTAPYEEFQKSTEVDHALKEITKELKMVQQPTEKATRCIFLGDIISDRLTVNQRTLSDLIRKLSGHEGEGKQQKTGVVFIAGNHETPATESYQFAGSLAKDRQLSEEEVNQLLKDCFKAAHLAGGILFTHHGVNQKEDSPGVFEIAFANDHFSASGSPLAASSPEDLEQKMNDRFLQLLEEGNLVISDDFRPRDNILSKAGFKQVHGHDGSANEDHAGVANLNSRRPDSSSLCPTGMVFQ